MKKITHITIFFSLLFVSFLVEAQVTLEKEVKITDIGLHFDGNKVGVDAPNSSTGYDYAFGPQISAHGDCVATYKNYVFVTWYKGGKTNRNMMLTRYNTETGTQKTIEFPHRHTGYRNVWWIGESHNTIAVGVSPLDGTIHMLFDMHAYSKNRPSDGSLSDDYFRYSHSTKNAAEVSDEEFTLSLFVKDNGVDGDYTHLSLNGVENHGVFSDFTYPNFFLNDLGDLFFSMRKGSSPNGGYHFTKYDAATSNWSDFIQFAQPNASKFGQDYNWGMYGSLKYLNGKIGIGFQRRLNNQEDKYLYQNGFYYGYSDDQTASSQWKNHKGEDITIPLRDADDILVYEPGDLVATTQRNMVYMVGGFDWTVTEKGDVHIIGRVKDNENNITKYVHTYKPQGASDFTTTTDFSGGSKLYTSGDDIFIIGLNSSGRVLVQKSQGGTSNFVKVYEATSGKRFRHGVVKISDGKLYYYLMERQSGDQQPLYLQIIDLDIELGPQPFATSILSPVDNQTFKVGENIQLYAKATSDEGEIAKVEFYINDELFKETTKSPYAQVWTPDETGTYILKSVAYKSNNASVISTKITVEVKEPDVTDLSGSIYNLKNVETGKYLMSSGSNIIASDSNEGKDKEWSFVKSDVPGFDYYNIDSEVKGTIRFKGGASTPELVSTSFAAPNQAVDKIWTVIVNDDGSYSFETKNQGRYLYHADDNSMTHSSSTDDRSKWLVESKTLSIPNQEFVKSSIKIYPNPAKDRFTIMLENSNGIKNIEIYNILGKRIYQKKPNGGILVVENDRFTKGVYLVKVISKDNQVHFSKLITN